jgi:hypothetical protein
VCCVHCARFWGWGPIARQGPKRNNGIIVTCWVQNDTRPIQKGRNKGSFLPKADHIPRPRSSKTGREGEVTKCLKQPPARRPLHFLHSTLTTTHHTLFPSLLSRKNQLARAHTNLKPPHTRHVCVAGVLQASAAGVLAVQLAAPAARGRGGGGSSSRGVHRRRGDRVAG